MGVCASLLLMQSPLRAKDLYAVRSLAEVRQLFPQTPQQMEQRVKQYKQEILDTIDQIKQIPADERTFDNTARELDIVLGRSNLSVFSSNLFYSNLPKGVIAMLLRLHPDEAMRSMAQKLTSEMSAFFIDIMHDKELYHAFKTCTQSAQRELLDEELYFYNEMMKNFIRNGLELPDEQFEQVKKLKKEIRDIELAWDANISNDCSSITVDSEGLAGLKQDFINSLIRTKSGEYMLGVDYPTYFNVMDNAQCAGTRKRLYLAFNNRAYPDNELVLKNMIAKRDELARLLGYQSFAHYDLESQMVGSPERAQEFLDDIVQRSAMKEQQEYEQLIADLPPSVQLTKDGKFYPWDFSFTMQAYKKKHFNIDMQQVTEYFPVEKTVQGLLAIYESFLSVRFVEVKADGFWTDDLRVIEVYDKSDNKLGYVLLDLYPRPHKYSHACCGPIVPAIYDEQGNANVAVMSIIANFPRAYGDKPPLLELKFVRTFFHEFGHALHELLGRTKMAIFSGISVKTDFVEVPSQMLEEWLWDKDIMKMLSSHYQTGESMPDDLLDRLMELKNFSTGFGIQRQVMLAQLSLSCFEPGSDKDIQALYANIRREGLKHWLSVQEDHGFASFNHLSSYSAKYYSYLWSKVLALDLAAEVEKHGFLNPIIGKKYIDEVIGRGGSVDPHDLMVNFLGGEPSGEAFFKAMGL